MYQDPESKYQVIEIGKAEKAGMKQNQFRAVSETWKRKFKKKS